MRSRIAVKERFAEQSKAALAVVSAPGGTMGLHNSHADFKRDTFAWQYRRWMLFISALLIVWATTLQSASSFPAFTMKHHNATLLFDDEFGGNRLDPSKWNTCYWWAIHDGCTNNPQLELEWYLPSGVSVHDGVLDIVATKDQRHKGDPYTSGMVSTDDCCGHPITFQFTYGYMEMRAKLPPGRGMWPAFWLVPADHTWPPEIDAMEWQGQRPRTNFLTIHWGNPSNPQQSGGEFVGPNLSDGFHTFGLDWESNAVTWYQDGQAVRTYTDQTHIPSVSMIVIVNLAIGGWLGFPNEHTHFPAHMLVKYVRVWSAKP